VAMGTFGTVPLAAHAVTLQIAATCFMVPNGIGQAATVRVGRALGAGDAAGLRRAGAVAIGLGFTFMAACAVLQLAAPRSLIGLFLDADAPGAADVVIALTGYWGIGVPLGAALAWGAGWGGQGIWAGFCAGLLTVSILLVNRWLRLSARPRV
jgi:MATE family multidrug resistance protein